MTPARTQLLIDAESAGYTVTHDKDGTTYVIKRVGRWKKPKGLVMHPDGCATRADVDLQVAAVVTSFKDMRTILDIP